MEETEGNTANAIDNVSIEIDETRCMGDFCSHCVFKSSEKGCNPITKYCCVCNAKMIESLKGNNYN
jgi:hypothetical protein